MFLVRLSTQLWERNRKSKKSSNIFLSSCAVNRYFYPVFYLLFLALLLPPLVVVVASFVSVSVSVARRWGIT